MRNPVFPVATRSETNQPSQSQKIACGLKFQNIEVEGLYYVVKTKVLISFAATEQLICTFVFANAKNRFSQDMAQIEDTCMMSQHIGPM